MNLKLIIALVFVPFGLFAQQTVSLQTCWNETRKQLPLLQNNQSLAKLDSLEQRILKTNYLPQLNAKAQATWQSDVTSVDIPVPNIAIDEPSQEQYKVYLEVNQLIWDGGRTKALSTKHEIETELTKAETDEIFYGFKQRVASLYFALMLSQQQIKLTDELISTLEKKLTEIEAGVVQGVVREAGKYVLQAEKMQAEQDLNNQQFQAESIAKMLNVLTGMTLSATTALEKPQPTIPAKVNRSQLKVYQLKAQTAEQGKKVLAKNRMPVVSAFGQAGYGKPGLNMLNNEADTWLMVGAGISWNIFDWNSSKQKREKLTVQQQMIDNSREQFLYQLNTEKQQYEVEVQQYQTAIEKDKEIIGLRKKITEDYSSQLKQGTVTSSAYIEELFKEQTAKITQQIHEIKLVQSQVALQILLER
ncbi:MAG: TolC family protein [Salinivirgaceae bacterium]